MSKFDARIAALPPEKLMLLRLMLTQTEPGTRLRHFLQSLEVAEPAPVINLAADKTIPEPTNGGPIRIGRTEETTGVIVDQLSDDEVSLLLNDLLGTDTPASVDGNAAHSLFSITPHEHVTSNGNGSNNGKRVLKEPAPSIDELSDDEVSALLSQLLAQEAAS